jgi:anti-sigma factor RsiW
MNINQVVTALDIQALVDNELSVERIKMVTAYLQVNETAYHYYVQILKQKNLLRLYWGTPVKH